MLPALPALDLRLPSSVPALARTELPTSPLAPSPGPETTPSPVESDLTAKEQRLTGPSAGWPLRSLCRPVCHDRWWRGALAVRAALLCGACMCQTVRVFHVAIQYHTPEGDATACIAVGPHVLLVGFLRFTLLHSVKNTCNSSLPSSVCAWLPDDVSRPLDPSWLSCRRRLREPALGDVRVPGRQLAHADAAVEVADQGRRQGHQPGAPPEGGCSRSGGSWVNGHFILRQSYRTRAVQATSMRSHERIKDNAEYTTCAEPAAVMSACAVLQHTRTVKTCAVAASLDVYTRLPRPSFQPA